MSEKNKTVSVILKLIVIISATVGIILSALASDNEFMGGSMVFMYFTVQSNIALALISFIGLLIIFSRRKIHDSWYLIRFVGTVSITLTGAVFCFVLAPTMWEKAWSLNNVLTHVVVPACSIADFFVSCKESNIKKISVLWTTVPPIIYAVYAGIGFVLNWHFSNTTNYPYFFLNWGSEAGAFGFSSELPFLGCAYWILIICALIILVALLYLRILNKLKSNMK